MGARIAGVAVHLPARQVGSVELEAAVGPYRPPRGIVERLTGISSRPVLDEPEQASDLAVAAAREPLAETGPPIGDVDLLGPGITVVRL